MGENENTQLKVLFTNGDVIYFPRGKKYVFGLSFWSADNELYMML